MIKHIVMWKFKECDTVEEKMTKIKKFEDGLMSLVGVVKELKSAEFQYNMNAPEKNYDATLISEFESIEDLNAYLVHPEHKKVSAYCQEIRVSRAAVDYEF
ncbi:MAG: Dabb family protein [Eubacteriales bacterium]